MDFASAEIVAVMPQSFEGAGDDSTVIGPGAPPIVDWTLSLKPKAVSAWPLVFLSAIVATLVSPWKTDDGENDLVPVIGLTVSVAEVSAYGTVASQTPASTTFLNDVAVLPATVVTFTRIVHCAGLPLVGAALSVPPDTTMDVPSGAAVTENPLP